MEQISLKSVSSSIAVHATFFFALFAVSANIQQIEEDTDKGIEVVLIDSDSQIVEQDYNNIAPEDTKYLSFKNNSVDEETKQKDTQPSENPRNISNILTNTEPTIPVKSKEFMINKATNQNDGFDFHRRNLASNDQFFDNYLKGVKEGENTALNAKEFLYYSFFKRMKDTLQRHWIPNIRQEVYQLSKTNRTGLRNIEKRAAITIILDSEGFLKDAILIEPSGLDSLDNSAIQAINSANKFPNPPVALIDDKDQIVIQWEFILDARIN